MERFMKENGWMINNMGLGLKLGQMELNLKVIIRKEKNMEKANFYGLTVLNMKVISLKIIFMEMEPMFGQMAENI